MFADSYPMREIQDGFFYEVDGKVCKDDGSHLAYPLAIGMHTRLNLLFVNVWPRGVAFTGSENHKQPSPQSMSRVRAHLKRG